MPHIMPLDFVLNLAKSRSVEPNNVINIEWVWVKICMPQQSLSGGSPCSLHLHSSIYTSAAFSSAVHSVRCPTLLNPVPWQNWMAAYLGYTLRMRTLFCGWPVVVRDVHMRRSALLSWLIVDSVNEPRMMCLCFDLVCFAEELTHTDG